MRTFWNSKTCFVVWRPGEARCFEEWQCLQLFNDGDDPISSDFIQFPIVRLCEIVAKWKKLELKSKSRVNGGAQRKLTISEISIRESLLLCYCTICLNILNSVFIA